MTEYSVIVLSYLIQKISKSNKTKEDRMEIIVSIFLGVIVLTAGVFSKVFLAKEFAQYNKEGRK